MHRYVFDAYGTLFDLHAAAARYRAAIGPRWQQLSNTWRSKHIEYTWHYSLTRTGATFWQLAERSLDFAIAATGVTVADDVRAGLLATYRAMPAYPEVREVLSALKQQGAVVAILSNGDPDMLADATAAAALDGMFDANLSVAAVGCFKPAPAVYQLASDHFRCRPQDICFCSSNRWDIAGAKAFGFSCVWVNRTGAPDEYPELAPDRVFGDLHGLLAAAG